MYGRPGPSWDPPGWRWWERGVHHGWSFNMFNGGLIVFSWCLMFRFMVFFMVFKWAVVNFNDILSSNLWPFANFKPPFVKFCWFPYSLANGDFVPCVCQRWPVREPWSKRGVKIPGHHRFRHLFLWTIQCLYPILTLDVIPRIRI